MFRDINLEESFTLNLITRGNGSSNLLKVESKRYCGRKNTCLAFGFDACGLDPLPNIVSEALPEVIPEHIPWG